jgi:TonB family protein
MSVESQNKKRRRRRGAGWLVAPVASLVAHSVLVAGALFAIARHRASETAPQALEVEPVWPAALLVPLPATVEIDTAMLPDLPPVDDDPPPSIRPWDARAGEHDDDVARTAAPADADGRKRTPPAPDRGTQAGAPPEHPFRWDRSTLRHRLTDGATEWQAARSSTARHEASPQAVRREPVVGLGDSPRSRLPRRAPDPSLGRVPGELALAGDAAGASNDDRSPARQAQLVVASVVAPAPEAAHAAGPLDAEPGARAFDVQLRGRAADDGAARAASNELHPGLIDYSRASTPSRVATAEGRGPSALPGASPRPSPGVAPDEYGARDPQAFAHDVSERTLDRRYDHYIQEISQRVNRVRDFPKALALRLEQGETIVEFVVAIDGRLGAGPRVVKTSGFEEFDEAAMRAVQRAAPFPPMPNPGAARPLAVSLRVTFDNPVVR